MDEYLADIASDLESAISEAENRLIEILDVGNISRDVVFRGSSIQLTVEIPPHAQRPPPGAVLRLREGILIDALRDIGLIPKHPKHPNAGLDGFNHDLLDVEIVELRVCASDLAKEALNAAESRQRKLNEAIACAYRALDELRNHRLSEALKNAEVAEQIEAELDPNRRDWCVAEGGGREHEDATGRTFLHIRNRIRDAQASMGDEVVFNNLRLFGQAQDLHARAELLQRLGTPHAKSVLLALVRCADMPDDVRALAARALAKASSMDLDEMRRFIESLGTLRQQPPQPLIREILRGIRKHGREARHHASTAKTLEGLLFLDLSSQLKQEVLHALEEFAEIDTIERILVLPMLTASEKEAVLRLVGRVISRPVRVRLVRPSNFERLVCWVLQRECEDLDFEVVGRTGDGGIDVRGCLRNRSGFDDPGTVVMVAQCKNRLRTSIDEIKLFDTQSQGSADERWFVTRARCGNDLYEAANLCGIKLIARAELRELLEVHAPGRYAF